MSRCDGAEEFQDSVVRLHEYLNGLGFLAAASGLIDDIRNALRVVESTDRAGLDVRQRRLQEENTVQLKEVLMRLTGDDDGKALRAWTAQR